MGDVSVSEPYYTIGGQRIAASQATAEQRYLGATQDKAHLQGVAAKEAQSLQQHYNDLIAQNYDPNAVNMVDLKNQIEGAKQRATMLQYRSEYEKRATGQGASVPTTETERKLFAKQYVHINPARFPGQGEKPTEASLYKGATKFYSRDLLKNYLTRGKAYETSAAAFMPKAEYAAKEGENIQAQIDALNRDISTVETQADYDKVVAASQALDQRIGNYNSFLTNSDVAGSAAYLQSEYKQLETERKSLEQRQGLIESNYATTSPSPGLVVAPVKQTTYNATTGEYGVYREDRVVSYNPLQAFFSRKGLENPPAFVYSKLAAVGAMPTYALGGVMDVEKWGIDFSKTQAALGKAFTPIAPGKPFFASVLPRYAALGEAATETVSAVANYPAYTGYAANIRDIAFNAHPLSKADRLANISAFGKAMTETETIKGYVSQAHFLTPPSITAFQEPGTYKPATTGITTTPQARALSATFAAKTLGGVMETATSKHWGQVGSEFTQGFVETGTNLVTYAAANPFKFAVGAAATTVYPWGAYALLGAQTAYNLKTRGASYTAGGLAFYYTLSKGAREAGKAYHNLDVMLKGYTRKEYDIRGYVTQDVLDYYNSPFWAKRGTQLPLSKNAAELLKQFKAGETYLPEKVEAGGKQSLSPKLSENPQIPGSLISARNTFTDILNANQRYEVSGVLDFRTGNVNIQNYGKDIGTVAKGKGTFTTDIPFHTHTGLRDVYGNLVSKEGGYAYPSMSPFGKGSEIYEGLAIEMKDVFPGQKINLGGIGNTPFQNEMLAFAKTNAPITTTEMILGARGDLYLSNNVQGISVYEPAFMPKLVLKPNQYISTMHATSTLFEPNTMLGTGKRAAEVFHVSPEGMLSLHFLRTTEGALYDIQPPETLLPPSPFAVNLYLKNVIRPGIKDTNQYNAFMGQMQGQSIGTITPKAEAGKWVEAEAGVPYSAATEIFRGDYFKLGGIRFTIPTNYPIVGGKTVSLFQWSVPVAGYKVVEGGTPGAIPGFQMQSIAKQGLEGIAYTKYYNPTPMREYVVPAFKSATYEAYKLPSYTPYKETRYTPYKPASYATYKAPSYTAYAIPSYTPYTKPRYTPYTTPSYTPYTAPTYTPYTPPRYTPYRPPSYTPYKAPRYPAYTPPEYPRYAPGATYEAAQQGDIGKAFDVLVRKKGKWLVIGKNLPKGRAYRLGILETERTPARSFKLEAKGVTRAPDVSIPPQILHYRPAKREAGVLIERSKYAINTQGEYAGITAKGIVAAKRVRPFKRGFKL